MTLFEDTEIFTTGKGGKKTFDFPDLDLLLIDIFFSKEESDHYYNILLKNTFWQEYEMPIYDKTVTAPRMVSWYNNINHPDKKSYSDWSEELLEIKKCVENKTKIIFNAVLLNLYRNGKDGVGWHSDKTISTNKNMNIASVTFGETRIFHLRHKFLKAIPQIVIPLHHGTFLLMAGTTNTYWEHQVPKTARDMLSRINLTFRQIKSE